jgi:hypothetical protein
VLKNGGTEWPNGLSDSRNATFKDGLVLRCPRRQRHGMAGIWSKDYVATLGYNLQRLDLLEFDNSAQSHHSTALLGT